MGQSEVQITVQLLAVLLTSAVLLPWLCLSLALD